jgi:hypothetical protein
MMAGCPRAAGFSAGECVAHRFARYVGLRYATLRHISKSLALQTIVDFRGQLLPFARPRAQIHRVGLGRFTGSMRNTVCYEIVAN